MELRDYLYTLRRRWRAVIVGLAVVLTAGIVLTLNTTEQYQSRAQMFISTQSSVDESAYQGGLYSSGRVKSYADLVTSRDVAEQVVDELSLNIEPGALAAKVTAQVVPETVLLNLAVRDTDPERAQQIAQAYTKVISNLVRELETPPGESEAVLKATTVESASLPRNPVVPNVPRNLALGALLGLLLGIGLAVVREMLDTSVKSAEDVTAAVGGAPLLAAIGNDPGTQRTPLVSDLATHEPRVEAYRVLRTNVQFIDVDSGTKAFVVSSAVPGEGKSTTSSNLAITLAMTGKRVLLVDGDLRRSRVADLLGLDSSVGLTSVLIGTVDVESARQEHASGLHVLTSGPTPPNPAELLQSQSMTDLIAALRADYDIVMFDAPPLLPVTDAALLAAKTDGAIIVVHHGKTTRDQVRGAGDRLEHVGARVLGVVLNKLPRKRGVGGYGYGYGYGYSPLETETNLKSGKRKAESTAKVKEPKRPRAPKDPSLTKAT